MIASLGRAWAWARAHLGILLGALAALFVAVLGAGVWLAYERRAGRSVADARTIAEARERVAALDERRRLLAADEARHAAAIEAIETQRRELQRQTVALDRDVAGLSDEEVESAFRALYGGSDG